MPELQIIDTFGNFLTYWEQVQHQPLTAQIEAWAESYLAPWPNLRQMQLEAYAADGDDWREMAREHVFPFLAERLATMRLAHENLLKVCADVFGACQQTLGFNNDLVCIIYVGIGCGAGWATTYDGKPAILFGLENIAAEGWQAAETLAGLMAHELGHLLHFQWRQKAALANESDGWWQLYTEGFAQWCEHLIPGTASWHMQTEDARWQAWCQANVGWLAAEFLRRIDAGEDLRPFFGSWFDLQGFKQTGYFLGYTLIKMMQEQASLREIALLTDVIDHLHPLLTLISLSSQNGS